MRRFLVIGVLFCLAVSGCAQRKQRHGGPTITYEVTGTGYSGELRVKYVASVDRTGNKVKPFRSSDYTRLPFRKEVSLGDYWDWASVSASIASAKGQNPTLTCTIKHDGSVVATKTGTMLVFCMAPHGVADSDNNN